jgi:hypothetical protein
MCAAATHLAYARVNTPGDPPKNPFLLGFFDPLFNMENPCYNRNMEARLHFTISVVMFLFIAFLYGTALYYDLPWYFWWYDIVLHIFGGMLISFVTVSIIRAREGEHNLYRMIMLGIVSAFVIGLLWEVYEIVTGSTYVTKEGYPMDTVIDIISDISGGIIGALYNYRHSK